MTLFDKAEKREQLYRHGGREVLRIGATHVTGKSAAAQHTEALVLALIAYAEQTILPRACYALDNAMKSGTGYAFRAYRYCINVEERRTSRDVIITLTTLLDAQGAQDEHLLAMCWTRDGTWQKRRHHRGR